MKPSELTTPPSDAATNTCAPWSMWRPVYKPLSQPMVTEPTWLSASAKGSWWREAPRPSGRMTKFEHERRTTAHVAA